MVDWHIFAGIAQKELETKFKVITGCCFVFDKSDIVTHHAQ